MLRISDLMAPRALTPGCNLLLPLSTSEEIPVSLRDRRGCREVKWSQHTSWAQLRASLSCGSVVYSSLKAAQKFLLHWVIRMIGDR